jgi:phosphopentomutase
VDIGTRETFADLGRTIADGLGLEDCDIAGTSFWQLLKDEN